MIFHIYTKRFCKIKIDWSEEIWNFEKLAGKFWKNRIALREVFYRPEVSRKVQPKVRVSQFTLFWHSLIIWNTEKHSKLYFLTFENCWKTMKNHEKVPLPLTNFFGRPDSGRRDQLSIQIASFTLCGPSLMILWLGNHFKWYF